MAFNKASGQKRCLLNDQVKLIKLMQITDIYPVIQCLK